jgi:hypothetical protein
MEKSIQASNSMGQFIASQVKGLEKSAP